MKRILFVFLGVVCTLSLYADVTRTIKVTLNNSSPVEAEFDGLCTISLTANEFEDSIANLYLTVTNKCEEGYNLLTFDKGYSKKELKKCSIRFDKGFNEKNQINGWSGSDRCTKIEAGKLRSFQLASDINRQTQYKIPLYIAKTKRKKMIIVNHSTITLNVKLLPDKKVFEGLNQEVKDFLNEIKDVTICPNDKHQPSIDEQKKFYLDKSDPLVTRIEKVKKKYNLNDKDSEPYDSLISELKNINFQEEVCKKCSEVITRRVKTHTCRYCGMDAESVHKKLEGYYKVLDNKKSTDKDKEDAYNNANSLHRAYTEGCEKLKKKVNGSDLKDKINGIYESIKKVKQK